MILFRNFKFIALLHENDTTIVYRALRIKDKALVILKVLKPESRDESSVASFANEAYILSTMRFTKAPKLLDVIISATEYLHVFEDSGSSSLNHMMAQAKMTLIERLDLALELIYALHQIHSKGVLHCDINPQNIIYNQDTKN